MARTHDEILELWARVVLVAFVAVAIGAATWNSLHSPEPSAKPIRIELNSVRHSGDAIPPLRPIGMSRADDLRGGPAWDDDGGRYGRAGRPGLGPSPDYELESQQGPSGGAQRASAIEIRKAVRINGADSGFADIRVGASSALSISRADLFGALSRDGRRAVAAQIGKSNAPGEFIDFEELRRQGFDVRFDARADRIMLSI